MQKETVETILEYKSDSLKIGNLTVNVRSCFYPQENLYDILFSIVSTKLKEKSA